MQETEIPVLVPDMPQKGDLSDYLDKIDKSKKYSNSGPLHEELIFRLSNYFQVPENCICLVSNATLGLVGSLICSEVRSEFVELPSFTFAATPSSVISARFKPLFVDIDSSYRMKPTGGNKLVIDVLPFGHKLRHANWYDSFSFCIIDAAASFDSLKGFGKEFNPSKTFSLVVSLHATKLLGAGEGGIVVSNDPSLIRRIQEWSNFGFTSGVNERVSVTPGTNAKLSEYSCAVALASLDRWPMVRESYLRNLVRTREMTHEFGFMPYETTELGTITPYWIIRHELKTKIEDFQKGASVKRVGTRKWWSYGCHKMPAYSMVESTSLAETDYHAARYLGLPFHNFLTEHDWNLIRTLFVGTDNRE